jgi:hypothetical protein
VLLKQSQHKNFHMLDVVPCKYFSGTVMASELVKSKIWLNLIEL